MSNNKTEKLDEIVEQEIIHLNSLVDSSDFSEEEKRGVHKFLEYFVELGGYLVQDPIKELLSHQKSELREKIKNMNLLTKDIPKDIVLDYEKSAIYLSGYEKAKSDLLE